MKKHIILISIAFLSLSLIAQNQNKYVIQSKNNWCNEKSDHNFHFWHDFETSVFPPNNWLLVSNNTTQTWQLADTSIALPLSGHNFAICRYDHTLNPQGQDEKLITESINLIGLEDAKLEFWFFFSKFWGISPNNNYDLQVLVSTDGGINFNDTIWTEISTDTAAWNSWDWVKAEVDISNYINNNDVRFAFRYVGFDGADAGIDDIAISFLSSTGSYYKKQLSVFPNPSSDYIYISVDEKTNIKIYNLAGKMVYNKSLSNDNNKIDISFLKNGVYIVNINNSKTNYYSRFIKVSN